MAKQILKYNQKHLKELFDKGKVGLIIALIVIAIHQFVDYDLMVMFSYVFIAIIYYFTAYFIKKKKQYITIEGNMIKKNIMFGGSINLNDVIDIKKFNDEYYLVTESKKFYINTALMDEESKQIILKIIDKIINQAA